MKSTMLLIILFIGVPLMAQQEVSQDSSLSLSLMSTYVEDKVILRWAYQNYETWEQCKRDTFQVERYEIDDRGVPMESSLIIMEVNPFTIDEFRPYLEAKNEHVIAVGDLLYGEPKSDTTSVYEHYHEARNRYVFAMLFADKSIGAATALGLRWEDVNVEKSKEYFYRVKSKNHKEVNAGYSSISTHKPSEYPLNIDSIIEREQHVVVVWDRETHDPHYTGYYIERSMDGVKYERLNETWLLSAKSEDYESTDIRYVDSVENYQPYYYRLVGHTPFNFETEPSKPVKGQARDLTPPLPPENLRIRQEADHSVVIEWEFPEPSDVAQLWVEHSLSFDKFYEPINKEPINAQDGRYVDEADPRIETNYYRLVYADRYGNQAKTIHLSVVKKDSLPPSTPQNFMGEVDTNGVVTLSWASSPEYDTKGYYLYRTNKTDHAPTIITGDPIKTLSYTDTITMRTLTEEVVYRITAVDYFGNYSEYSEPLVLKRPDLLPPNPAIFSNIKLVKKGIQVDWDESNSKDVVKHILSRRVQDGKWQVLKSLDAGENNYLDRNLEKGKVYHYRIQAEDDAGWRSEVIGEVSMRYAEVGDVPVPKILKVEEGENGVELEWENLGESYSYVLAKRTSEEGKFITLRVIKDSTYVDLLTNKLNKNIAYRVQAVHEDGRRSRWGR